MIILFFLIFSVNIVSSQIVNTTQYGNFTIQWENFNLLICAVPTTINISLFTCLPSASQIQVNDIDCLQSTMINFDQNTCQTTTNAPMYTSTNIMTSQKITTTVGLHTSVSTIPVTTQSIKTTVGATSYVPTSTFLGTNSKSISSITSSTHTTSISATSIAITHAPTTATVTSHSSVNTLKTTTISGNTNTATITSHSSVNTNTATITGHSSVNTMKTTTISSNTNTATIGSDSSVNTMKTTTISSNTNTATITDYSSVNTMPTTTIISNTNTVTASNDYSSISTTAIISSNSVNTITTTTATNIYRCLSDEYIGIYCNISSNPCEMAQPCLNAGTCFSNYNLPIGYYCICQTDYSGYNCEYDDQPCTENKCWHNGTCIPVNTTITTNNGLDFKCECVQGYDGIYCQLQIDVCGNITCENRGICVTVEFMWKCLCLDSTFYYGDYCQFQTTKLKVREILSKSFASIAIGTIITTCSFIIIMDILKYIFHIDPVAHERESYRKRLEAQKRARRPIKNNELKFALRFQYIS